MQMMNCMGPRTEPCGTSTLFVTYYRNLVITSPFETQSKNLHISINNIAKILLVSWIFRSF